jgi:PEP-CTERM motif
MSAYAKFVIPMALTGLLPAVPATADPFFFSTGAPDGKMATATRPSTAGKFEIESADDFVLTTTTSITSATFTGLLTGNESVGEVRVEIYRVFPNDSDVGRTSGPPTFSTPQVPTRVNSPSDVELVDRDTASGNLTFATRDLGTFSALNSVQPGGIHPKPGQTTGGNGAISGEEFQFNVNFTTPFDLPADHYFFVPQVEVTDPSGNFFWLSAPRPIVAPGTPFPPGSTDLQSWTRDENLAPDWLRVGTDIVGGTPAPTFNAVFSLTGNTVPEPSTWAMILIGFVGVGFVGYRKSRNGRTGLFPA